MGSSIIEKFLFRRTVKLYLSHFKLLAARPAKIAIIWERLPNLFFIIDEEIALRTDILSSLAFFLSALFERLAVKNLSIGNGYLFMCNKMLISVSYTHLTLPTNREV